MDGIRSEYRWPERVEKYLNDMRAEAAKESGEYWPVSANILVKRSWDAIRILAVMARARDERINELWNALNCATAVLEAEENQSYRPGRRSNAIAEGRKALRL